MRVHAIMHGSRANGPGLRSVVWFAGCSLGCAGCVNPATHDPNGGEEITPDFLAARLFAQMPAGTVGVTISGGEPFQQPHDELIEFVYRLHALRPGFSVGMFTGYGLSELRDAAVHAWLTVRPMLDFVKVGRFQRDNPAGPNAPPLCTSANQQLILPTSRYTYADFGPLTVEYNIEADGLVVITGFPLTGRQ